MLLAMGFLGPERGSLLADLGVRMTERGTVWRDASWMTSEDGVFAAATCSAANRHRLAIADGRSAARGVDAYLMGASQLHCSRRKKHRSPYGSTQRAIFVAKRPTKTFLYCVLSCAAALIVRRCELDSTDDNFCRQVLRMQNCVQVSFASDVTPRRGGREKPGPPAQDPEISRD